MKIFRHLKNILVTNTNHNKNEKTRPEMSCEIDSEETPTSSQLARILNPYIEQVDMSEAASCFNFYLVEYMGVKVTDYSFNLPVTWNGEEFIVNKGALFSCAYAIAKMKGLARGKKIKTPYIQ